MANAVRNKKFVIIGGSSGIGFAVAKLVVEEGAAEVIIASSTQSKLDDAVKRLQSSAKVDSTTITGKLIDMSNIKNVPALFQDIGNFDHLVSTAGGTPSSAKFPDEVDLEECMTNSSDRYWSVLKAIQASHKQINKGGSVTVTSGTTIRRPLPGWSPLSGIAGAIETATRNLAIDMAPIRVNCVAPGVVDTEMWSKIPAEAKEGFFKSAQTKLLVDHIGLPEEIAEAYLFCFRCGYLTGQTIFVEGGGLLM